MAAEAFIIRELTGSKREIRLLDRALPYQGVAFPREQHVVQRWYPGNPSATIQVLGPRVGDVELTGKWKARFLLRGGMVQASGFVSIGPDGAVSAETLVAAFDSIVSSGNQLEVRWGPEVRRGVMTSFVPTYDRPEDIDWTAKFTWSQKGTRQPTRAAIASDMTNDVRAALDAFDLIAAEQPRGILPNEASGIRAAIDEVRASGAAFTEALAQVQAESSATLASVQRVQVLSRRAVNAGRAIRAGNIADVPYVALLPTDGLREVFAVERWRRDLGASGRNYAATSARAGAAVEERYTPGAQRIVTVGQGETLRMIARRELGSADAWTVIADANNIVGSNVPVGTRLVIPRPSGQGATAR